MKKRGITPHASQVIYAAINSKPMNIVRVQKAQETKTTPAQPCCNINAVVAMLH